MIRCCALGLLALGSPALAAPPLEVRREGGTKGDGRSLAELSIGGGPPRSRIEPAGHPVLPFVACDWAAAFAARGDRPPAVLAPAVSEPRAVICLVERRGTRASVEFEVQPPGPGLYAELRPTYAGTGDPPVAGVAFVLDASGTRLSTTSLQVAASTGTVKVEGDRFTITLPSEKAPQLIAVALVDGERVGATFLPVRGRVELPVSTMSGAEVRVRVAGEWFGPVRAKRGKVTVPLEVPLGVATAVVRAADPVGNVGETVVDLNTPDRPRLAVAAPGREVSAGSKMMLAVAYATPDGRPAGGDTEVEVEAERGQVGTPVFQGGGLWAVPYTALAEIGQDQVVVRVKDDPSAGEVGLAIRFVAGRPARLELRVPPEPLAAGTVVDAEVRVLDWIGLPLADASARVTVNGEPATVERVEGKLLARLQIPDELSPSGELRVDVDSESAHLDRTLRTGPAPASTAELIIVESHGRSALVRVAVFDRFGNAVARDGFELEADGGQAAEGHETDAGWETRLIADEDVWQGSVRVLTEAGAIAEATVEFSPPNTAFHLGVGVTGGVVTNGHGVYSPRGRLALLLRRGFGAFELGLSAGVDGTAHSGEAQVILAGESHEVARDLTAVGVPIRLSGRRWLASRFGVAAGVSVVPMYVRVSVSPDFQATQVGEDWVIGLRGDLRAFVPLGPGEVFVEFQVSGAQLEHALATGTIERFAAGVGYAFWVPGLAF